MNTLPQQADSNSQTDDSGSLQMQPAPVSVHSGGSKEIEPVGLPSADLPLSAVGVEAPLPKEVSQAGVTQHGLPVSLPPQVVQAGVQQVGMPAPISQTSGQSVKLPLTDDQISDGLTQKVHLSIRWLAEWCVVQIKKLHKKHNTTH